MKSFLQLRLKTYHWFFVTFLTVCSPHIIAQNLTMKTFGTINIAIDISRLDLPFGTITANGTIVTGDFAPSTSFTTLPTTVAGFEGVQMVFLQSFGGSITTAQADALIDFVKGGGVMVANLEGTVIGTTTTPALKYIGEALFCNTLTLSATPGGTAGANPTRAYHPGNGALLLNSGTGANTVVTTGTYSTVSGLPSANIIFATSATATCSSVAALDFVIPAYPNSLINSTCAVKGLALCSGEAQGILSANTAIRNETQINKNYAQLIFDFLYDPAATATRRAWSATVTNTNTTCPPALEPKPLISKTEYYVCNTTTADLSGVSATNKPATASITIHSATPATTANKLSSTTALAAGTYYAAFFNSTEGTYTPTQDIRVIAATDCTDTDADGLFDQFDIDDDNDGVLDAVESPACFLTDIEWNTIDKSANVQLSSTLVRATSTNLSSLLDNFQDNAVQFATSPAQAQTNAEIFRFSFKSPVYLDAIYIKKAAATNIFATSGVILQASSDGSNWTSLTAAVNPANATNITENGSISLANSNKIAVTQNAGNYLFYRIVGSSTAGNILGGIAQEFYFDINSNFYNPSFFAKSTTCTVDSDGDGKPNHLDLDSDGDGCSDALEAATTTQTTANFQFPSTGNGTNGFADALETTADSGVYKSNYSYTYATSKTIATCVDSDGDSVNDISDLDDDNDGILDHIESPTCFYSTDDWNTRTRIDYAIVTSELRTANPNTNFDNVLDNNTTTVLELVPGQAQAGKTIFRIEFVNPVALERLYIQKTAATNILGVNGTVMLEGSNNNTNWTALLSAAVNPNNVATVTTTEGDVAVTNATVFTVVPANVLPFKYYRLLGVGAGSTLAGIAQEFYFDIKPSTYNASFFPAVATCTVDTDVDGKPNHLDLDSDGDGCSDAFEAGATISRVPQFKFVSTAFGTNGLINSLESPVDSGTLNYIPTYINAIDKTVTNCCAAGTKAPPLR